MWFDKRNAVIKVNSNVLLCMFDRRMSLSTRSQTSMLMVGSGSHEGRANDQSRSHSIGAVFYFYHGQDGVERGFQRLIYERLDEP